MDTCVPPTNGSLAYRVFADYLVDIYLPAGRRVFIAACEAKLNWEDILP